MNVREELSSKFHRVFETLVLLEGWLKRYSLTTVSECDTRTEYLSVCVIAIRFLESAIAFLINYATQVCVCILGKPNYGTGTVIDSGFCSFLGCERWRKMTNFASWLSELSIPSSLPLAPFPEVQVGDILCLGTKEGRNTWICEDLLFVCARVARASRRYVFPICTYVQWYPTIHLSNYPSTHPWPSKPAKWKPRMVCWNFPPLSSIWFSHFWTSIWFKSSQFRCSPSICIYCIHRKVGSPWKLWGPSHFWRAARLRDMRLELWNRSTHPQVDSERDGSNDLNGYWINDLVIWLAMNFHGFLMTHCFFHRGIGKTWINNL